MALIQSTLSNAPMGNPAELLWANTGTDPYIRIDLLDSSSNILYQGVFYEDANKVIYANLQPILKNLVSNKDFNIKTINLFETVESGTYVVNVRVYESSSGTYSSALLNSTFYIKNSSLLEKDWYRLYVANDYSINYRYKEDGNNLLDNSLGYAATNTNHITDPPKGSEGGSNSNSGFTITYSATTTQWLNGANGGTPVTYTLSMNNVDFVFKDVLTLNFNSNYYLSGNNSAGDIFNVKIYQYNTVDGDTLLTSKNISPDNTNSYKFNSVPFTFIDKKIEKIKVVLTLTATNNDASIYLTDWYLGNNFKGVDPNREQTTFLNVQGSLHFPYKLQDIILNKFNQYYAAAPITTFGTYANYLQYKNPIKILRYSPLNVQTYSALSNVETGYVYSSYINVNTNENLLTADLRVNAGLTVSGKKTAFNNFSFGYNVYYLSDLTSYLYQKTTHIFFDYLAWESNSKSAATPAYGRRLIFELVEPCYNRDTYQLYYLNRSGGIDWIILTGNNSITYSNTQESYKTRWRYGSTTALTGNLSKTVKPKYLTTSEIIYNLNSDILYDYEYNKLEELFSSPELWLYDAQSKETFAVEVIDTDFKTRQNRFDKLSNLFLQVKQQLSSYRQQ